MAEQQQQVPTQKLPLGYRFNPSKEELVSFYLYNHISSGFSFQNLWFCPVSVCDLYGSEEPWDIWTRYQSEGLGLPIGDAILITKLKRSGKRFARSVGACGGSWHRTDKDNEFTVRCSDSLVLDAVGRNYEYKNRSSKENQCWALSEYSISFDGRKTYSDQVICRLKNKHLDAGGKRKRDDDNDCYSVPSSKVAKLSDTNELTHHIEEEKAGPEGDSYCSSLPVANVSADANESVLSHQTGEDQSGPEVDDPGEFCPDDDLSHFIRIFDEAAPQLEQVQSTVEPIQELPTPPLDHISFSPQVPLIDYNFDFTVDNLTHFIQTLNEEDAAEQFQQVQQVQSPQEVPLIDYDFDFIDCLYSPGCIPCPLSSDFVDSVDSFSYLQDDCFLT
ncbi:hypothetical protein LINGRAHAP2_LOCUS22444 [Linum grandiflorum]